MSKQAFEFRPNYSFKEVSPQVIGETILANQDDDGIVQPKALVDVSRPDEAPLHPLFEWDDEVAAECHRLHQARTIIRSVKIVEAEDDDIEDKPGEWQSVKMVTEDDCPAFVSVTRNGERGYASTRDAVKDADLREQILEDARAGLIGWRRRFGSISAVANSELARVAEAIDEAINVPA